MSTGRTHAEFWTLTPHQIVTTLEASGQYQRRGNARSLLGGMAGRMEARL